MAAANENDKLQAATPLAREAVSDSIRMATIRNQYVVAMTKKAHRLRVSP